MKTLLFAVLVMVASCSFRKSSLDNQTLKGHDELYSEPEEPSLGKLGADESRIVIASTNDMHGMYSPKSITFKDAPSKGEQEITVGGKEVIQSYFKILRDTYKNVVLVDSGDIFASGSELNETKNFYTLLNYDALTVGLRDFNLKVPSKVGSNTNLFQNFAKTSSVPLLLSNLYELKTARVVEWEGTKPYILKEVDGVKVGIVGLIPDDIVGQTPVHNRVGLFVENMLQSTLRQARLLRSLGADVIVVLTHQGIDCNTELSSELKLPLTKVNFEPRNEKICDLKGVMGEYLTRLPHGLIDVVVGGRNHQKMANFVNGTLVMGGFGDGMSFNFAELVVNKTTKKIVAEKTVVHQPVMFCQEFFKETNDCYTDDPSVDHKRRTEATFLGKRIEKDLSDKKSANAPVQIDIQKGLNTFLADLTYVPVSSGETQLVVLKVSGKDLITILDEEFNAGHKSNWQPSPFLVKDNELSLSIQGMEVETTKTYRILTDLESAQKQRHLLKLLSGYDSEAYMNHSWHFTEEDNVNVQLAAQAR